MNVLNNIFTYTSCIFCAISTFAQSSKNDSLKKVSMYICDTSSLKPASYINIYNTTAKKGTVSNFDGYFELEISSLYDNIVFSAVGYKTIQLNAADLQNKDTLLISSQAILLKEFNISPFDPGFISIITACRRKRSTAEHNSKTYFELESYINGNQVELVEIYFNGLFKNYHINQLNYKEGRVALEKFNDEFFVSTDISKAFYSFDLFNSNNHFPKNPLQLSKNELSKQYRFNFKGRYPDQNGNNIVAIQFYPKNITGEFFEGTLWIDSTESTIQKLHLNIDQAVVYPFLPLFSIDSIRNVSMEINVVFDRNTKGMVFSNLNFHYGFDYHSTRTKPYTITSNALLYAYDPSTQFIEPLFENKNVTANDYRYVSAAPYNSFFWNNPGEFQLSSDKDKTNRFFNSAVVTNKNFFNDYIDNNKSFFQNPYLFWSPKRIRFKEIPDSVLKQYTGQMPSARYYMGIKLYVDINLINDSLNIVSASVYDPYSTFFYFSLDDQSDCFLNLYFDLVEIVRREFETELDNIVKTPEAVKELYYVKNAELKKITDLFLLETEHGTNQDGMVKWNKYVEARLQINNINLFGLYRN